MTAEQEMFLATGISFACGENDPFLCRDDERSTWNRCGESIMAENRIPGRRPYGFYVHDLGMKMPGEWWEELAVLESKKLLAPAEIVRVEALHQGLDTDPESTFMQSFLDPKAVRAFTFDNEYLLRRHIAEVTFYSDWHARRGRAELSARFGEMADVAHGVLESLSAKGIR